ncbi:hypothetical protein [Desulfovibrio sp.]|uniref:hypothetical protein n=1 Tax=Desulfovibrio sp. TaxID=885 RepID=UPI0023C6A785|nr:hypothetical protein [Desulfovibrio sp.]MDE7240783.1 hypothetical protein [Desulfovibrio sp.]
MAGAARDEGAAPAPPPWPEWLMAARVADSAVAAAYEATASRFRAALKTGLALAHFHFGESASRRDETETSGRLGFQRASSRAPAPWALLILSPAYAAAARLTAACAAALLAGVPHVAALSPGGAPRQQALVSLELSGVEDIFSPAPGRVTALLDELAARPGPPGRVVLLHEGFHDGEQDDMAQRSRAHGLPCYSERRPPRLRVEAGARIDRKVLAFAHGGEEALAAALAACGPADAVFRPEGAPLMPAQDAPLTLGPGCEGFWLHPGLTPEFFTVSRQAFAPWPSRDFAPDAS